MVAATFFLMMRAFAVPALSMSDAAVLLQQPPDMLQDPLSLGQSPLPLANNMVPSSSADNWPYAESQLQLATRRLREAGLHQQLQQQQAANSMLLQQQLAIASQRLDAEQRVVSEQLEEAGVAAHRMLDDLKVAASSEPTEGMSATKGSSQPSRISDRLTAAPGTGGERSEKLALPQTMTQLWRQRNPALAALLLEPALYGYSVIVWALVMLATGISSAFCVYMGKLQFRNQGLPAAGQPVEPVQNQRLARLSQLVAYPGSYLSRAAWRGATTSTTAAAAPVREVDEEEEGVETWIRMPAQPKSQGYLDESDGEGEHCRKLPAVRHQSCGYVDEC